MTSEDRLDAAKVGALAALRQVKAVVEQRSTAITRLQEYVARDPWGETAIGMDAASVLETVAEMRRTLGLFLQAGPLRGDDMELTRLTIARAVVDKAK